MLLRVGFYLFWHVVIYLLIENWYFISRGHDLNSDLSEGIMFKNYLLCKSRSSTFIGFVRYDADCRSKCDFVSSTEYVLCVWKYITLDNGHSMELLICYKSHNHSLIQSLASLFLVSLNVTGCICYIKSQRALT